MKAYREWRISGDGEWLSKMFPLVKKSLDYCIETWDPEHKGTIEEPHHNTYDIEFWGSDGMHNSFYIGALQAIVRMGKALNQDVSAYESLLNKARDFMENKLYNGEYFIQQVVKKAIASKLLASAHDISDGGVFAALLESAMPRGLGFDVRSNNKVRKDAWLFGEAQSRVLVSVRTEQVEAFERFLQSEKAPYEVLGAVTGPQIQVDAENWGSTSAWQRTYSKVLEEIMNHN